MKREAAMQVIIPIMTVKILMVNFIVLKIVKSLDAIRILPTVRISPINEANSPMITVARYFPMISSLTFIGNVNMVSRVPFSFSTAVAEVAILVPASTIAIMIYVNDTEKINSKIKFSPSKSFIL